MRSTPLSRRVIRLRRLHSMTQKCLAKKSGIALSVLNKIESGEAVDPKLSTIQKLVLALHATPDYLLEYDLEDTLCRGVVAVAGRMPFPKRMMLMRESGKSLLAIAQHFDCTVPAVECVLNEEYRLERFSAISHG